MRQLALACNTYHSIHNAFPCGQVGCPRTLGGGVGVAAPLMYKPGDACVGAGWLGLIMVHLDEAGIADAVNKCADKANFYEGCNAAKNAPPGYLICASAPETCRRAFYWDYAHDIQSGRARHSVRAASCQSTRSAGRGLPALPVLPNCLSYA